MDNASIISYPNLDCNSISSLSITVRELINIVKLYQVILHCLISLNGILTKLSVLVIKLLCRITQVQVPYRLRLNVQTYKRRQVRVVYTSAPE